MMRDNRDIRSVKDLLIENEELQARIDFLQKENNRLLREHRDLHDENSFLKRQINGMKFSNGDLRRELDRVTSMGAFARSLGVGVNDDNLAELEFTNNGEAHYNETWNINCGDDF